MNTLGNKLRVTVFGQSHAPAIFRSGSRAAPVSRAVPSRTAAMTASGGAKSGQPDREKGVRYEQRDGVLTLAGALTPGTYRLPGSVSSQFVTGLLYALPLLEGDSEIVLTSPLEGNPVPLGGAGVHVLDFDAAPQVPGRVPERRLGPIRFHRNNRRAVGLPAGNPEALPIPFHPDAESFQGFQGHVHISPAFQWGSKGRGRLMERPQKPYFDLFDEKGVRYEQRDGVLTLEPARLRTPLPPPAKAAAIRQRWAWDLLGGGVTVPASRPGVMVRFIDRGGVLQRGKGRPGRTDRVRPGYDRPV